jgi:hypothetical protein
MQMRTGQGMALLREGKRLLGNIAGARVPMPLSTELYIEKCQQYEVPDIKEPQSKFHVSRDETG